MSLIETFRASSARRQLIVAALVAAMLVAILVAAYVLVLRKPYAVLFTNLRTMDAATIVAELDKKHIPYRLADGGATIRVPRDVVDSTRLSVMSEDLPIKGAVGFELFNKSDMGLTEFAQQINYQRALQGELARTIMTLDVVDSARIHLSLSEPTIFRDDRRAPKASVTIVTRPGRTLSPDTVGGIQRLVAAAVPDLVPADVVVLNANGRVVSGGLSFPAAPAAGAPQQRAIEEYYAAKVRESVAIAYPDRRFSVSVAAERPSSASPDGLGEAFNAWTPGSRHFSLEVTIGASPAPGPSDEARIRTLAGQAIGLETAIGDVVNVSASGPAQPGPPAEPAAVRPGSVWLGGDAHGGQVGHPWSWGWWWPAPVIVIVLLVGSALVLQRRANGPQPLSARQRRRYVRRLETLLAEGDADAAPTA